MEQWLTLKKYFAFMNQKKHEYFGIFSICIWEKSAFREPNIYLRYLRYLDQITNKD